jgi:V8-like Glu-specific endopeptidase
MMYKIKNQSTNSTNPVKLEHLNTCLLLALLFCIPQTFFAQPDTIIVYDYSSNVTSTILPVSFNQSATFDKTFGNIGTLGNQVLLNVTPPTTNLFVGSNFSDLDKASNFFNLSTYPLRTAVALREYSLSTTKPRCSGIMISPNFVLTAAHCVYNYPGATFYQQDSLGIFPAYNNGMLANGIPSSTVKKAYIFKTYFDKKNWDDIALLELKKPIGNQVGWVGMAFTTNFGNYANKVFHKFSYPAAIAQPVNKPYNGDTMYYNYGYIDTLNTFLGVNSSSAIGIQGQSGSSFLYTDNVDFYTMGVMNFSTFYQHYRITKNVFYQFQNVLSSNSTVGLEENSSAKNALKVYPNPFQNNLGIDFNFSDNFSSELINSLGQVILKATHTSKDRLILNTEFLAKGIYILKVRTINNDYYTTKVVKE